MNEGPIDVDAVLDLCRDQHRRIVLAVLAAERRPVPVSDLAKTILEYDAGTQVTGAATEVRPRIRASLHHVHLPKVASAGLVEYDPDRELVEPTAQFERSRPLLSAIADLDPALADLVEP